MVVYKAIFPNGKVYVGCTSETLNKRKRMHKHFSFKRNGQTLFARAIRKYGWDNIIWEELYNTDNHIDLLNKEQEFIKELNTLKPNGYNLTAGGEGTLGFEPWNKGKKSSPETIEKMKLAHIKNRKAVVIINEKLNSILFFDSIAEACRQLNLPYAQMKTSLRRKQPHFQYRIILKEDYNG